MVSLQINLDIDALIQLIRQLPAESRRTILYALATEPPDAQAARLEYGEQQLRTLAHERGLDWGALDDEARLSFVDDLIHESRQCTG